MVFIYIMMQHRPEPCIVLNDKSTNRVHRYILGKCDDERIKMLSEVMLRLSSAQGTFTRIMRLYVPQWV